MTHSRSAVAGALLLFLAFNPRVTRGQSVWEPPQSRDSLPNPTVPVELVNSIKVGGVFIVLGRTPLTDLHDAFGGTLGEGDYHLTWLCLAGADSSGEWVAWFESDEIHRLDIGGMDVERIGPGQRADARCARARTSSTPALIPRRIALGMTREETLRILGTPTAVYGDTLLYIHQHRDIGLTGAWKSYIVQNSVYVVIRENVVVAIGVWWVTIR
jgi:hypothetical protein